MKNIHLYILTTIAIICMSATCCIVTVNYDVKQENISSLNVDSVNITLSCKFVSYAYGSWGMDINMILQNNSSKPVLVYPDNIDVVIEKYLLTHTSVTINGIQSINFNTDTLTKGFMIHPHDTCSFRHYLSGSPKMTLKKVARNNSILNAFVTVNHIYIENKEIQSTPFALTIEQYPSKP